MPNANAHGGPANGAIRHRRFIPFPTPENHRAIQPRSLTMTPKLPTLHFAPWAIVDAPIRLRRIATDLVRTVRFLICHLPTCAAVLLASTGVAGTSQAQESAGLPIHIESWSRRDSETELRLSVPTEFGRRCRIEVSTNLVTWETKLVTEAAQGAPLSVVIKGPATTPQFVRATLFDWEELRAELQAARRRWSANGSTTYHFHFHWLCNNCHPNFKALVRVDVHDGAINAVTKVATGEALPRNEWVHLTVEGLFNWIEAKLALHPEVITATFDPVMGHPVSGFYDQSSLMNDEEMGFELSSLSE